MNIDHLSPSSCTSTIAPRTFIIKYKNIIILIEIDQRTTTTANIYYARRQLPPGGAEYDPADAVVGEEHILLIIRGVQIAK